MCNVGLHLFPVQSVGDLLICSVRPSLGPVWCGSQVPEYLVTLCGCWLTFIDAYIRPPEDLVKYSIENLVGR